MGANSDFRFLKEKKIDKETTLNIKQNIMSRRLFVEFISKNPNLVLQKSFPDNYEGKLEADEFSKSIKNTSQLREYFGLNNRE